jgi:hypothetical protein
MLAGPLRHLTFLLLLVAYVHALVERNSAALTSSAPIRRGLAELHRRERLQARENEHVNGDAKREGFGPWFRLLCGPNKDNADAELKAYAEHNKKDDKKNRPNLLSDFVACENKAVLVPELQGVYDGGTATRSEFSRSSTWERANLC